MPYKHTQIRYVIIVISFVAASVALVLKVIPLLFILGVVGALFSTRTVSVDGDSLKLWFSFGFFSRRFSLEEIEACQISKFRWWSWWIQRLVGKGSPYNVPGVRSVELKMRGGPKFYIGTDQPEVLEKAIRSALLWKLHRTIKMD